MTTRKGRLLHIAAWLTALVLIAALLLNSPASRKLLSEAIRTVDLRAVLVMLPVQLASSALCALALAAFRPGATYWGCLASRLLRDAGANLPVVPPGTGEAMGARALVLAGGGARPAIVATTLDTFAETLAQVPYIALAAWLLFRGWNGAEAINYRPEWAFAAMLSLLAGWFVWRRLGAKTALAQRLRAEWTKLAEEARTQRAGMPMSFVLHFFAWLMGGLQVWLAASALGFNIGLFDAVAIESAAYAGRAVLFFVPAGLVAQEAGLVAAGLLFGLTPAQSLAIGLAMRMRDLVFGLPLLVWPLAEMRRRRSP